MNSKWLKTEKTAEGKEKLKKTILSSKFTLDILRNLVYNMYVDCHSVSKTDYDSPSWASKQAHKNGEAEALWRILQLLDFTTLDDPSTVKKDALTHARNTPKRNSK